MVVFSDEELEIPRNFKAFLCMAAKRKQGLKYLQYVHMVQLSSAENLWIHDQEFFEWPGHSEKRQATLVNGCTLVK